MKYILISLIFGLGIISNSSTFADSHEIAITHDQGEAPSNYDWEKLKTYCEKGAINKQDRAHKPTITCDDLEQGGSYQETQIKEYYYKKNVVDDTFKAFTATFSTDKAETAKAYTKSNTVQGTSTFDEKDDPVRKMCITKSTITIKKFTYNRPDTCTLIKEFSSPKRFCDFIYEKVLTAEDKKAATDYSEKISEDCRNEKGGKY